MPIRPLKDLKTSLEVILNKYDEKNPTRKPTESKIGYFFRHLSSHGGLFKGEKGRDRSIQCRAILDTFDGTSEGFLKSIANVSYVGYSGTQVGSELCRDIFNLIAVELEMARLMRTVFIGGSHRPIRAPEDDKSFFPRVYEKANDLLLPVELSSIKKS